MANEGDLNKVDGDIFYDGDVTALLNANGVIFETFASQKWADGVGEIDRGNSRIDSFSADSSNSNYGYRYISGTDNYVVGFDTTNSDDLTTIDECNDSSINATIWDTQVRTGDTVSEGAANLTISADGAAGSLGTSYAQTKSTHDIFATYGNYIRYGLGGITANNAGSNETLIIITDGSNTQTIRTLDSADDNKEGYIRKSGNTVYYSFDGAAESNVDVTAWGDIILRFLCTTNPSTSSHVIGINWLRYAPSLTVASITTTSINTTSNVTNAMLFKDSSISTGVGSYFLTADNGGNWESITPNQIHHFTNVGSQVSAKIENTTSNIVTDDGNDSVTAYAIIHTLY